MSCTLRQVYKIPLNHTGVDNIFAINITDCETREYCDLRCWPPENYMARRIQSFVANLYQLQSVTTRSLMARQNRSAIDQTDNMRRLPTAALLLQHTLLMIRYQRLQNRV